MSRFFFFSRALQITLLLWSFTVFAGHAQNSEILLQDNFESYTAGAGTLTAPWSATGGSSGGIVAEGFSGGGKAAYIGYNRTGTATAYWNTGAVWRADIASGNRPVLKISASFAIDSSTNGQHDSFAMEVYNQDFTRLVQLSFVGTSSRAIYHSSSAVPGISATGYGVEPSTKYTVELELDFRANTWSAKVGPTQIVSSQPMAATGVARNLAEIDFAWFLGNTASPGNNFLYYDDVLVELISGRYPFIVTPPAGAVKLVGESVSMEVTATGEAPLSYVWKKDGAVLEGASSAVFTKDHLTTGDAGSYTVTVTNPHGNATSLPAGLLVTTPGSRSLAEWGQSSTDAAIQPPGISDWRQVATGNGTDGALATLAVRQDGTVHAWGGANSMVTGKPSNLVARHVALGRDHALAVKYDGSVVAWGDNAYGQSTVPSDVTSATSVSGGIRHSIALMADGTLRGWGSNYTPSGFSSSYTAQAEPPGGTFTSVASGYYHNVALTNYSRSIATWGSNGWGQRTLPVAAQGTGYRAVAAGAYHTVAVLGDGTVVAWGRNSEGQCNVPAGLSGVKAVAAGFSWTAALKEDGSVTVWGGNENGVANIPAGLSNVRLIAGGGYSMAAVFGEDLRPVILSQPQSPPIPYNSTATLNVSAFTPRTQGEVPPYLSYLWYQGSAGVTTTPLSSWNPFTTPALRENTPFWVKVDALGIDTGTVISSTASETAMVVMDPKPVIHSQSGPISVLEGSSSYIQVNFGAGAPYTIQWFKDGEPITGGSEAVQFAATFSFPSFLPSQAGEYHAKITNASGNATSQVIRVETRLTPPDQAFRMVEDFETGPEIPLFNGNVRIGAAGDGILFSSRGSSYLIPSQSGTPMQLSNRSIEEMVTFNGMQVAHDGELLFALAPGESAIRELGTFYSPPRFVGVLGGLLYFTGYSPTSGVELWRTDGTASGTIQVIDLYPGGSSGVSEARLLGDKILLIGTTATSGRELFVSDGTAAGTTLLADIYSGTVTSSPQILHIEGGKALFGATSATHGLEPWITDGTPAGTIRLADLSPGTGSSSPTFRGFINGKFLFSVYTGTGSPTYATNGTPAGTLLVSNYILQILSALPSGKALASGYGPTGNELYVTDGTAAGTSLLKEIEPSTVTNHYWNGNGYTAVTTHAGSNPAWFGAAGSRGVVTATNGSDGTELYGSDGTAAGTMKLADLATGTQSPSLLAPQNPPPGPLLTFLGSSNSPLLHIYRTDGTAAGTQSVRTFPPRPGLNTPLVPHAASWVDGKLHIFTSKDNNTGYFVDWWVFNPSDDSLTHLQSFFVTSLNNAISSLNIVDGAIWFLIHDAGTGPEWWTSRGTPETTRQVTHLHPPSPTASSGWDFTGSLNGNVLFIASRHGERALWTTDSVTGASTLLAPIVGITSYTEWNGKGYMGVVSSNSTRDLWVTDGTPEGTQLLKTLGASQVSHFKTVPFANGFVFRSNAGGGGEEPWFSDGTTAGTYRLADLYSGVSGSNPDFVRSTIMGGKLIFAVQAYTEGNTNHSSSLISWNGSSFTRLMTNVYTADILTLGASETSVYFTGYNQSGKELWITNGTPAGTQLVKDVVPGLSDGVYHSPQGAVLNGKLIYQGIHTDGSTRTFVSDGTSAGTFALTSSSQIATDLTIYRNKVYYLVNSSLWETDGTVAGTRLVLTSSWDSGSRMHLFNDTLYITGNGVWHTNGTVGGTHRIHTDYVSSFFVTPSRFFIRSTIPGHGNEPMVLTRNTPVLTGSPPSPLESIIGTAGTLTVNSSSVDLRYQWYEGEVGDTSRPVGSDSPELAVTAGAGWKNYWVRIFADLAFADSPAYVVEGVTQLEKWARQISPPLAPGQNSPLDLESDTDGDGRNALAEFASGTDPAIPDVPAKPLALEWREFSGSEHLAIRYLARSGAHPGVTYAIRQSDLTNGIWEPQDEITTTISPDFAGEGMQERIQITPVTRQTAADRNFYRLEIKRVGN